MKRSSFQAAMRARTRTVEWCARATRFGDNRAMTAATQLAQVIICGMHRSGTSLVASVLREAGLDIGREEFVPGLGQPRGHFEDHDFYHLHEAMLAAAGRSCFTADEAALGEVAPEFEGREPRGGGRAGDPPPPGGVGGG